ncbi:MAG: 30S ribosomal protein S17 [Candidatus Loosdrechtia sp.]|uniref:small ribosomal subunit protein uS17 n=1 Tax=Candidatus Loosdrechtia sp. TaxID=3101272 RepID=UPI003A6E99A2|nr:MAG: 30S ribosomal protein S17 [Candidatus Jettenia sp. AMX2]
MGKGNKRGRKKSFVGTVIGDKMQKTVVVEVTSLLKHPKYGKYIKRASIFKVHDENNQAKIGDKIEFMHTRPVSKTKNTRLVRVLGK